MAGRVVGDRVSFFVLATDLDGDGLAGGDWGYRDVIEERGAVGVVGSGRGGERTGEGLACAVGHRDGDGRCSAAG